MRSLRCSWWPRVLLASVATAAVPSCVIANRQRPLAPQTCEFIVYDRTPRALEIRLRRNDLSSTPIGTINPGEALTHSAPCSHQRVWVVGVEIPWQVGAALRFGVVYGEAELVEGESVQIPLYWP